MSNTETDNVDFVLDPSDPLYMLLNNTHDNKPYDFSFNPMDLDLSDPSFSVYVDPSALFINGKAPLHSAPTVPVQPQDLLNSFAFSSPTLSSASASADDSPSGFSPPSPGGSSSARASPPAYPVSRSTPDVSAFFPQAAGHFIAPFIPPMAVPHSVPLIPTPPPPVHTTQGPQTHVINTATTGRPKTSHTTIERRYRTNLNARIQSLKAAVPALRVLDQNHKSDEYKVDERGYIDGVKVARKGSKANVLGKAVEYIRVLKRRETRLRREQDGLRTLICGFPGGQNILSEWEIEWVKKFGGPEKDEIDCEEVSDDEDGDGDGEDDGDASERARKKPKLEPTRKRKIAPAAPIQVGPGGEVPGTAPGVVEKRKRGRPRKIQPNIPPPVSAVAPVVLTDPGQQGIIAPLPQSAQPQQYLLAVFALFSFFNSPFTSSSQSSPHPHHTHQGSVLSHVTPLMPAQPATGWTWNDVIQIVHLLASLAVFISIVVPWIPVPRRFYQTRLMQLIPFASLIHQAHVSSCEEADLPTIPGSPDISDSGSEPDSSSTEYTVRATKEAPSPVLGAPSTRGAADEFEDLLRALKVGTGWLTLLRESVSIFQPQYEFETRRERTAWTRLAELVVLSVEKISMSVRWQVYSHLSRRLVSARPQAASDALVSDLCTLALLTRSLPFAEAQSQAYWTRAHELSESIEVSAYQRLVLDSLTLDEAMECLTASKSIPGSSPIVSLASILLRERLHSHASSLFIHRVSLNSESNAEFPSIEESKTWSATLSYGRSLGGDIGLLSDALARVWQDRLFGMDIDVSDLKVDIVNEDVLALLRATVLYGQVFAGQSVPQPPLNARDKDGGTDVVLLLRRVLGSSVFDESGELGLDGVSLEDARDRVVDMIVSLQRERKSYDG